ncbi:MAG: hypothetical protein ABL908_03985 [Hyphomicrobium sp.]
MTTRFAAAIAAMLVVPVAALPQLRTDAAPGAAAQGKSAGPLEACRADVDTLCASDPKSPGWRGKCLRENTAKLSDACKSALAAMRAQRETVLTVCAGDIEQHCKAEAAEKNDGGRPMRCLKSNEDKLSAGCKSAMTAFGGGGGAASEAAR